MGLCGCTLLSRVEADGENEAPRAKFVAESLHVPAPVETEGNGEEGTSSEVETDGENAVVIEYPQIKEDDPMYEDVSLMVKGLTPVFSYFAFKSEDMDLSDLSAEDFWLLMAMIAADVNGDNKDADGSVSLQKDVLSDYAATFFGSLFFASGLPDWKGTTSASSDPRSQVISLSAMGVDGYHGKLAGFEASPDEEGYYDLYLEIYKSVIEGAQTGSDAGDNLIWKIVLEPWNDDSEHAFAFKMKSFSREENEVLQAGSESADSTSAD